MPKISYVLLIAVLGCSSSPSAPQPASVAPPAEAKVSTPPAVPERTCEELNADAAALLAKHNACSTDADCVFARDDGGCPDAFACTAVVNKADDAVFSAAASALSRTYRERCGRCINETASCRVATPMCKEGRCSRR